MDRTTQNYTGLSAFQLKIIALIFMTIDHVGAYAYILGSESLNQHYWLIRTVGRIAFPIFLYLTVSSAGHTSSKPKFLLRLYLGGVFCALITELLNMMLPASLWAVPIDFSRNIFYTLFYTVLFITLIELLIRGFKNGNRSLLLLTAAGLGVPFLLNALHLQKDIWLAADESAARLVDILLPAPFYIEYSFAFVVLGVLWYFIPGHFRRCLLFAFFCVLSYAGTLLPGGVSLFPFTGLFGIRQFWMILALPLLLFYNGERGRKSRSFFYLYYILHRPALIMLFSWLAAR